MSRIGGAFPFPTGQNTEGGGVIVLNSGQAFYPPAGEGLLTTGLQTAWQWFDPVNTIWRTIGDPGLQTQAVAFDGYNWRLINLSGVVVDAQITAPGSGGTNGIGPTATGASVSFGSAPSGGRAATGYPIVGGSVQAPTVTQGGSGFLIPPLIVIDPPAPGGVQATAYATISAAGVITGITMLNVGAGYVTSPNFWIIPQPQYYQGGPQGTGGVAVAAGLFGGPGAIPTPGLVHPNNAVPGNQNTSTTLGALLTPLALTGSGTLTGIGMLDYGAGYSGTTIPGIVITGVGAATATPIMSMTLLSVTLNAGGVGYGTGAPPNWETSAGLILGAHNNHNYLPRVARGVTTVTGGAVVTFVVEDPGFGFQKVPIVEVINTSAIATTIATGTAVVGGTTDTSLLQMRVQ